MVKSSSSAEQVYDYIIVGAGSAGCVLADRLSANPDHRVLILEAGGSDKSFLFRRPGALAIVYHVPKLKKRSDWDYRTTPQDQIDNREMPWTRGKVIGGCSSVNGMLYVRGNRENYDQWRDLGNPGWGYEDVLPYFKRSENHEDGESDFHGGSGPLHVTRQQDLSVTSSAFNEAMAEECGVSVIDDFNGAQQEGTSIYQMTCHNRKRMSTSVCFLYPALKRGNLDLQSEAKVQRILFEGKRAVGIEYIQKGETRVARAEREVILAAGAINSPHLLLLSGVGPSEQLTKHGIEVVHDLPGVGENLQDHLFVPIRYDATKASGHTSTAWHYLAGMAKDFFFKKGWYGKTFLEGGAFVKSTPDQPLPDLQYMTIPWAYPEPNDDGPEEGVIAKNHSLTILTALIYPKSRGVVSLKSADPDDAPLMDPRYLSDDEDMQTLLRGLDLVRRVAEREPLKQHLVAEATPGPECDSTEQMRAHVRLFTKTVYHPVGTCKMGMDDLAVVDPSLNVHGLEGIRVVDASIMPTIVGGNTNAPTIMIAEKAADMIRADAGT